MHKLILKFFEFLKNITHFIRIAMLFLVILTCFNWVENITGFFWGWLDIFRPIVRLFVELGGSITQKSIEFGGAELEFKYVLALIFIMAIYYFAHLLFKGIGFLESFYERGRNFVKQVEQETLNSQLRSKQIEEQSKLKKYRIYVTTRIKKKFSHKSLGIDLEEQNKKMNKFLIEKLEIQPSSYRGGYLYEFENFNHVDSVLAVFFKLLKIDTPIEYLICIQICGENEQEEKSELDHLIRLEFWDKISMFSPTSYRYKFNNCHRYGTSLLGLFQYEEITREAFQFEEI